MKSEVHFDHGKYSCSIHREFGIYGVFILQYIAHIPGETNLAEMSQAEPWHKHKSLDYSKFMGFIARRTDISSTQESRNRKCGSH